MVATDWPSKFVVLSTHFDDGVMSMAGLMSRASAPVTVVTVHGGPPAPGLAVSSWDSGCGFSSPEEAYGARRLEDTRACSMLGVGQALLPLADGPYLDGRGLDALDDLLAELEPGTELYVPLGTNQPDHTLVRDHALRSVAGRTDVTTRLYADLPYTSALPEWNTDEAVVALPEAQETGAAFREVDHRWGLTLAHDIRLTDEEWARKRDAVLCYASQLCPVATMPESAGGRVLLDRDGPLRRERAWTLGDR